METPRLVAPLLAALGAIAFAIAAADRFQFHAGFHWPLLAAAALAFGVASGILWEQRTTSLQAARNAELQQIVSQLEKKARQQREESEQDRQASTMRESEAAQALRDSEALYHSLVDHLPQCVLRKDEEGTYTFVNRRYLEFSGKALGEILGTTDFDIFPHELATRYRQGDERVLSTGALFEDVETYQKPDGEKRYIQVLKTPIRDAQQKIIGTQIMFWDVTDRRRSEEALARSSREIEQRNAALRESEQSLQKQTGILTSILNSIADGVVVADQQGRFLVWNPAAGRIIGLGPVDKPSENWTEAYGLYKTDRKTPYPAEELPLRRAIRGETVTDVELFVLNKARAEGAFLSVNGTPLVDAAGQIQGGVVVFRDVTGPKAAAEALLHSEEEIRSKNQDLETLLYVTSHDLREPLRAIENFSRIVSERYADKLDAKGQDFLDRVVRGAQRLDRLIEDVLTLSRVQRQVQPSEDVATGEIVADVLHHLETRIRETQADVQVEEGLPSIRADRRWATQAVQNLVSNALKYAVEGQAPVVQIGTFRGPEGVGLIVRDRGMGVPPDCTERIFQLFQRAVSRNIEGTGAGLAIVKRVAERHGGKAWVRPREGGGSEFIITFGSSNPA